jgi:hypothetical protein
VGLHSFTLTKGKKSELKMNCLMSDHFIQCIFFRQGRCFLDDKNVVRSMAVLSKVGSSDVFYMGSRSITTTSG